MDGGIASLVPRQKYGFGSFVKSVTRSVKKAVKSPIGQIALSLAIPQLSFMQGIGAGLSPFAAGALRSGLTSALIGGVSGRGLDPRSILTSAALGGGLSSFQHAQKLKALENQGTYFSETGEALDQLGTSGRAVTDSPVVTAGDTTAGVPSSTRYDGFNMRVGQPTTPAPSLEFAPDVDMGYEAGLDLGKGVTPLAPPGYPTIDSIQTVNQTPSITEVLKTKGPIEALKTAGSDIIGLPEIKQITEAEGISGKASAILNYAKKNPTAVIGSASTMAYLTTPEPLPGETEFDFENRKKEVNSFLIQYGKNLDSNITDFNTAAEYYNQFRKNLGYANGGRIAAEMGGIMNIPMGEPRENQQGIKELDYRQEGGFVPVGIKEKADDVPAMLSKNEFVMTADAVRGMGNGSIENGAQKMYNLMKSMENRIV
jgi:hypothetical protein